MLGSLDLLLDLVDVGALLALAQLLLDRLDLLVEVEVALVLLHLALDAATDLLVDVEDVDLALDLLEQVFQPLLDAGQVQHRLLVSSLSGRWAAMVSARRPGSSMLEMEVRISGGIFLLSLTYWSNCCITARRSASISLLSRSSTSISSGVTVATKVGFTLLDVGDGGALLAFDQHLDGAVGQLEHLQDGGHAADLEHVAHRAGSSLAAAFCATSMMRRSDSIAVSRALMLLGRPTNSGMTMWGNTTTSRSGSSGRSMGVVGRGVDPDIGILFSLSAIWLLAGDNFNPKRPPVRRGFNVDRSGSSDTAD
jgi:hypothetical protein